MELPELCLGLTCADQMVVLHLYGTDVGQDSEKCVNPAFVTSEKTVTEKSQQGMERTPLASMKR